MAIIWTLRRWLAVERDIYRPSELQLVLIERAGYHLTNQAVSNLMKGPPSELRLRTIQALCRSLNCKLSDFCEVVPDDASGDAPQAALDAKSSTSKRKRTSQQRRERITFPIQARSNGQPTKRR